MFKKINEIQEIELFKIVLRIRTAKKWIRIQSRVYIRIQVISLGFTEFV